MPDTAQTPEQEISAGHVVPGAGWFVVIHNHAHKTLRKGDMVQVVEDPTTDHNRIYRLDGTLHELEDDNGLYVDLVELPCTPRKEGPPTTGALYCPSTGWAMQPHQRQEHSTTTREEPQTSPSQHPHSPQYQNAAERLGHIRNEILHSAYRMAQQQLLIEEDCFRLHKAACCIGAVAADLQTRADQAAHPHSTPESATTL